MFALFPRPYYNYPSTIIGDENYEIFRIQRFMEELLLTSQMPRSSAPGRLLIIQLYLGFMYSAFFGWA
jgi:hypothetical protein